MRRRFRRYPPPSLWICILIAGAAVGRWWWGTAETGVPPAAIAGSLAGSLVPGECEVLGIQRGDLINVRQRVAVMGKDQPQALEVAVQLLGVSIPAQKASPALQQEGKLFTAEFLSSGAARLDLDRRRLDGQGHFLAYVYCGEGLLNEELIRAGLAQAETYPGDNQTLHRALIKAEKEARRAGRGIWAEQP